MKISLNWLRDYIALEQTPQEICDILTEIGLEVEGMETIECIKGGLRGVVVGEVQTCEKHPNADRLSLTTVDVGSDEKLQIVCGAPNVAVGQKVLVATIGTTLYDREGSPWQIKKGKIRGTESRGMICAEDELGLGNTHDGIVVMDDEAKVGAAASEYFDTGEDIVYDIGLTPNRSDATCHLGVARDLAAALKINHGHTGEVVIPSVDGWKIDNQDHKVTIEVENHEACPRYAGVSLQNITIGESPQWLKDKLNSIGVRPINNVVDATNFVLHELGQPLHAFDQDQITDQTVRVKTLEAGTTFLSLDEKERSLSEGDLMICDGHDQGLCIAGVFGGLHSGVTNTTTNLFLESAHFDSKWVRRSSTRHLLFSDAAKVFEKGSDPNICVLALKRAALLIKSLTGGQISSEIQDIYPHPVKPREITLSYRRLNALIGTEITPTQVQQIVKAMDMVIRHDSDSELVVTVPTNKADVAREADLIEEILRIYGYNRVPVPERMHFAVNTTTRPDPSKVRDRVADYLATLGFQEMMNMSMVDKKYTENVFRIEEEKLIRINNTSNVQVEVMRPKMLISALETIRNNQYRQQSGIRLFEFGKSYQQIDGNYHEANHLSVSLTGWSDESWLAPTLRNAHEFFVLKSISENILNLLGIERWKSQSTNNRDFSNGMDIWHKKTRIASLGKIHHQLLSGMDVKGPIHYLEFDWDPLLTLVQIDDVAVEPISRFPSVRRDLAVVVERSVSFSQMEAIVTAQAGSLLSSINLFDIYEDDQTLGPQKKSYAIGLTFRDKAKTLSDKEVDKIVARILQQLEKQLDARLR